MSDLEYCQLETSAEIFFCMGCELRTAVLRRNGYFCALITFWKNVYAISTLNGQRCQTSHLINIAETDILDDVLITHITDILKQSSTEFHLKPVTLSHYIVTK